MDEFGVIAAVGKDAETDLRPLGQMLGQLAPNPPDAGGTIDVPQVNIGKKIHPRASIAGRSRLETL